MGEDLEKETKVDLDYFVNKTLFFMEKIELIKDDIELWFREGIILNKIQLEKLITRVDNKCIKYIKKSNKRCELTKKTLKEEKNIQEKHKYYNNYVSALVKVLSEISEDEDRNELLRKEPNQFMKGIDFKVEERFLK